MHVCMYVCMCVCMYVYELHVDGSTTCSSLFLSGYHMFGCWNTLQGQSDTPAVAPPCPQRPSTHAGTLKARTPTGLSGLDTRVPPAPSSVPLCLRLDAPVRPAEPLGTTLLVACQATGVTVHDQVVELAYVLVSNLTGQSLAKYCELWQTTVRCSASAMARHGITPDILATHGLPAAQELHSLVATCRAVLAHPEGRIVAHDMPWTRRLLLQTYSELGVYPATGLARGSPVLVCTAMSIDRLRMRRAHIPSALRELSRTTSPRAPLLCLVAVYGCMQGPPLADSAEHAAVRVAMVHFVYQTGRQRAWW